MKRFISSSSKGLRSEKFVRTNTLGFATFGLGSKARRQIVIVVVAIRGTYILLALALAKRAEVAKRRKKEAIVRVVEVEGQEGRMG